jgi:hypothetical protein
MATSKEYAYYLKGNKVAIVQKDYTSSGGQTLSQPGLNDLGNIGALYWKSPKESITDGLEIQYVYSPFFNKQSTGKEGVDFHRFIGWGSDGSNLLLFTYGVSDVTDLSSLFAVDDYINISNSSRWNGLHQVKSTGGSTGILTLKTKVNLDPSYLQVGGNFATDETFIGGSTSGKMDIEAFKDGQSTLEAPYIFIDEAADVPNNGFFSLTSDSTSGQITVSNKITIDADGDYTSTAAALSAEEADTIIMYNAFYDQMSVYEGVEVMQDESFELDVTRYQANAVTYYVKAKYAEDAGNIEMKEYFMREFRRMVEKHESSKIIGPRILQGYSHFR